jgi:hypothetical protein
MHISWTIKVPTSASRCTQKPNKDEYADACIFNQIAQIDRAAADRKKMNNPT